jgi:hypothetical protein
VSADFDKDDLARLVALEHAFYTIALIAAANFAHNAGCKPGEAVAYFRSSADGLLHGDTVASKEAVREHLKRLFDNLTEIARLPVRMREADASDEAEPCAMILTALARRRGFLGRPDGPRRMLESRSVSGAVRSDARDAARAASGVKDHVAN